MHQQLVIYRAVFYRGDTGCRADDIVANRRRSGTYISVGIAVTCCDEIPLLMTCLFSVIMIALGPNSVSLEGLGPSLNTVADMSVVRLVR